MYSYIKYLLIIFSLNYLAYAAESELIQPSLDIRQTTVKVAIAEGVTLEDAIESMKLRANVINMKMINHFSPWKELMALGIQDVVRTEILEFCHATIAHEMIKHEISYLAYMPCRIGAIETKEGEKWLVMLNLDIFINHANMPPDLKKSAERVRDDLLNIMRAGARGEL